MNYFLMSLIITIIVLALSACAPMTEYCPEQMCKAPAVVPVPVPVPVPLAAPAPAFIPQPMTPFVLHGVNFHVNSYQLTPEATAKLNKAVAYADKYPKTDFKVNGYCSKLGGYEYNQKLAVHRAQSVAEYLEANGVNSSRLTVQGFGYSDPVATNSTRAGRYLNQRVEIVPVK